MFVQYSFNLQQIQQIESLCLLYLYYMLFYVILSTSVAVNSHHVFCECAFVSRCGVFGFKWRMGLRHLLIRTG